MSTFIPEPVDDLFVSALKEVPRPLGPDVIARTFAAIEESDPLLKDYQRVCGEYSPWTVNKFGAMAVRHHLGWAKETGGRKSAKRFTNLTKSYSRLVPEGESTSPPPPPERAMESFLERVPELHDWMTSSQVAETLGMTRSAVHKKMVSGDFKTLHRLGDKPYLVVLRSEVERENRP